MSGSSIHRNGVPASKQSPRRVENSSRRGDRLTAWTLEAHPSYLRYERNAGAGEPPAPRDRLLRPRFRFPESSFDDLARAFKIAHMVSEAVYVGEGAWDVPGDFPCLDLSYNGARGGGDGLFETASAGLALLEGFRLTKDVRYLEASRAVGDQESTPIGRMAGARFVDVEPRRHHARPR